jgi:hypothetical protein
MMVMERAERSGAERVGGVPNLTYDLVAMLHEKLEAITVYEIYKRDAREAGHTRALSLIEHCQETDRTVVQHLRKMLAAELGANSEGRSHRDMSGTAMQRGGDLSPLTSDEMVDDASEDSFPASDPPSFNGSTVG